MLTVNESLSSLGEFYLACSNKKIFAPKSSNDLFHIEPPKIVMKLEDGVAPPHKSVKIINHTARPQKCFVLPLESDQFIIKFKNQATIAPGLYMPIDITLNQENPDGVAWLKIYCFDDDNLMIPLETEIAEPPIYSRIPKLIDFGIVPLCASVSRKIMISSRTQENVISNVTILEPHIDVLVEIIEGANPNDATYVKVIYRPTSYSTMTSCIMICTPNITTHFPVVLITGYCQPPPYREELEKFHEEKTLFLKQCKDELSKRRHLFSKNEGAERRVGPKRITQAETFLKRESQIPWWLQKDFLADTHGALLGPLGRTISEDDELKKSNKKLFQEHVAEIKERNKNVERHVDVVNLGITGHEDTDCNIEMEWKNYMKLRTFPSDEAEVFESDELVAIKERIIKRPESTPGDKVSKEDVCSAWFTRFHPLCRFIQAGRRVVLRNRLAKRLRLLQDYISESPEEESEEEFLLEMNLAPKIKFFGSSFTFILEDTPR